MANPFEPQITERKKSDNAALPVVTAPEGGYTKNPFEPDPARFAAPPPPEKEQEFADKVPGLRTIDNIVRRLANGATMGLMDRVAGRNENDESFKKEHPYVATGAEIAGGVLPGMGAGLALGKAVPALGKASIPSMMGNAAVTGGAMSPVEDVIKGHTDPLGMLTRAGIGAGAGGIGAGVIGGALRALPAFKFRAAGSDLTAADKAGMGDLAATGDRAGIPLRIPELAAERAAGRSTRVEGLDNYVSRMKSGEITKGDFDAARLPNIERAVENAKTIIGPAPETGLSAQQGAQTAIDEAKRLVKSSSAPLYRQAEPVVLPRQTDADVLRARGTALKDKTVGPTIAGDDPNSIKVLQKAAGRLEAEINAAKDWPDKQALLIDKKRTLLTEMEKLSPEFKAAQETHAGGMGMVDEVKAGPLGKIAATTDSNGQARAILDAEPNAARKATERLRVVDPDLPRGMLATEAANAAKDPITFGRRLAPDANSEVNMKGMLIDPHSQSPFNFDELKDILTASRARSPAPKPGGGENSDGPIASGWNLLQDFQGGGVAKLMNDPKNISKLGDPGELQRLLQAFGLSTESAISDANIREPLVVDVKKPRGRTREANSR